MIPSVFKISLRAALLGLILTAMAASTLTSCAPQPAAPPPAAEKFIQHGITPPPADPPPPAPDVSKLPPPKTSDAKPATK